MEHDFRVALVTGASRGLGQAVCHALARNGYCVIGVSRTFEPTSGSFPIPKRRCKRGTLLRFHCDVRSGADTRALVSWVDANLGRLDVLVNNAGVGTFIPVGETSDKQWETILSTNLTGAFLCTRESIPLLEKSGGGLIVNVASIAAIRGLPNLAAYSASKAGLVGMGQALAAELRPRNIHVCNVLAGAIATEFWNSAGLAAHWSREDMMSAERVAELLSHVIGLYPDVVVEQLVLMPARGLIQDVG
ncbi:MAG: SDR family oxidoreductase [Candidatus Sumerlaeaceae bacterium]